MAACPSRGQLSEGFPLRICKYFPLMGLHHELLGEGTGLGCSCCACVKCHCWCCFVGSVCPFACNACLMFVHVCLLGIHTQSCHWLGLQTCSSSSTSSSFTPLGMPDPANPNCYGISKCTVSTLCVNGKVKWTNKIGR